jgi:hypothetical protein
MASRLAAALLVALLGATGAGFAVAALYLGLREVLSAPLAAAATSALLLALAGIVHLATRRPPRKPATTPSLLAALPVLNAVRNRPALSLLAALGLGALLEQLERRK